ncbi:hypothetical protein D6D12_04505 [Aureobasidium pullulans]|uniref:F-box domain-containing protein n=1 Tax=Aureobasidium pullulans TaxID=5580 RepID=A0AB74JV40_AURPU|nr:hypothetical protein D6D12_04505 [Aureobasidium pullulans]THX45178.1 hypothetical protein D6D11_07580 [Aureobasidium pullulans]
MSPLPRDSQTSEISTAPAAQSNHTSSSGSASLPTATVSPGSAGFLNTPTFPILTLSTEILVKISEECEDSDLPNMRLVCREFCNSSTKAFGQVYFADLHVLLVEPSLDILVEITAHPIYGRCVKTIVCGTARTIKPVMEYDEEEEGEPIPTLSPEFERSEGHIAKLVTALNNLKHHGNLEVALGIHSDEAWTKGNGFRLLGGPITYDGYAVKDFDASGTLGSLLEATSATMFPINKKCFRFLEELELDRIIKNDTISSSMFSAAGTFNTNTSIRMDFIQGGTSGPSSIMIGISDSNQLDLTNVLLAGEISAVLGSPYYTSSYIRVLKLALDLTKFELLTLTDMTIDTSVFQTVFAKSEGSIKHLKLSNVITSESAPGEGEPTEVLCYLKDQLQLESLTLDKIEITKQIDNGLQSTNISIDHLIEGEKVFDGHTEVQEALETLISRANSWF